MRKVSIKCLIIHLQLAINVRTRPDGGHPRKRAVQKLRESVEHNQVFWKKKKKN
jgi:hypothetical protein